MRSVVRVQPDREARREGIRETLAEAVERLIDGGTPFAEISVERLCQEAGISRATFYLYFQDKGDLLSRLAEHMLHSLGDTTEFWWHLPSACDKDALRDAFARTFRLYQKHRGVLRSLTETAAYDQAMSNRLEAIVAWAVEETTRHIEDGIDAGTIHPDVDPRVTAQWLSWMFERGLYEVADEADEEPLDRLLDALTEVLWNMLYRGA